MAKWEYCAVRGIERFGTNLSLKTSYPSIWYFTEGGIKIVEIAGGASKEAAETARTIAKLGSDGWEMVGVVQQGDPVQVLYFKRPTT